MTMRILIADDEQGIIKMLTHLLTIDNHEVFAANQGKEAVLRIMKGDIDLLFLDFSLPIWNGEEVLEELEAARIFMKTIILSGCNPVDLSIKFSGYPNVLRVVQKPFLMADISEMVREAEAYSIGSQ